MAKPIDNPSGTHGVTHGHGMAQPMTNPSVRAHAPARAHSNSNSNSSSNSPTHPTSTEDAGTPSLHVVGGGGTGLVKSLEDRGVVPGNARSLVADHDEERVLSAVAWFDQQASLGDVGPGLLVRAVRDGRKPRKKAWTVEQHAEYGNRIAEWLRRQMPEVCPDGNPHPAAVVAVIHLHHRNGKGSVTRGEHGDVIRRRVDEFDKRWLAPGGLAEVA